MYATTVDFIHYVNSFVWNQLTFFFNQYSSTDTVTLAHSVHASDIFVNSQTSNLCLKTT